MKFVAYKIFVVLFWIFNLFDTVITFYFVTRHQAVELNPVMNFLININPWLFVSVKMFLGSAGAIMFGLTLDYKISRIFSVVAFVAYALVMLYYALVLTFMVFK